MYGNLESVDLSSSDFTHRPLPGEAVESHNKHQTRHRRRGFEPGTFGIQVWGFMLKPNCLLVSVKLQSSEI
jgi:hypothetical protein